MPAELGRENLKHHRHIKANGESLHHPSWTDRQTDRHTYFHAHACSIHWVAQEEIVNLFNFGHSAIWMAVIDACFHGLNSFLLQRKHPRYLPQSLNIRPRPRKKKLRAVWKLLFMFDYCTLVKAVCLILDERLCVSFKPLWSHVLIQSKWNSYTRSSKTHEPQSSWVSLL